MRISDWSSDVCSSDLLMSTPRTVRRSLLAALALVLGLAVLPLVAQPAAAELPDQLVFDGRGYGHGRGLSQYGAQGYAKNHSWTRHRQSIGEGQRWSVR